MVVQIVARVDSDCDLQWPTLLPAVIAGAMPLTSLLYIPLGIYSVPVDPKGRPDYFLAETFG